MTGLLLSLRPSSSLGSSISQRLAPSSSGLTPALGRYSPPLCRGNKMAAAVPPCARIHSPPLRGPLGPGLGAASRGCARTVVPSPLLGRLLSPSPSFCLLLWTRARAHVLEHTPPHIQSIPAGAEGKNLLPLLALPLCSGTSLASRRMPGSSQFPWRETCLLCPEHGPEQGPWKPFP